MKASNQEARSELLNSIAAAHAALKDELQTLENPRIGGFNVINYAACCEHNFKRNLYDNTGRTPKWTWFSDISMAEWFDAVSVKDTILSGVKNYFEDAQSMAELILSINYKSWEMAARDLTNWSKYYAEMFYAVYDGVMNYYDATGQHDKATTVFEYVD